MNRIINPNGISIYRNRLIFNGREYEIPEYISTRNITVINNKVFISGYEFKNGEWKRTLRALWHKYF